MLNRRQMLAATAAAGAVAGARVRAASFDAPSGEADDYRALVCVFLSGGLDAYDTVIPMDRGPHEDWRRVRGPLTARYDQSGAPRRPDTLLAIGEDADGAAYGLPPEMPRTAAAVRAGRGAIVANVGPLLGPVTPKELAARSVPLPKRLFSHADQQAYWRRLTDQGDLRTGWGGRLSAAMGGGPFAALSGGRDEGFTMGPDGPGVIVGMLDPRPGFGILGQNWADDEAAALFLEHLGTPGPGAGILERDFAAQQRAAADLSRTVARIMASSDVGQDIARGRPRDTLAYGLGIVARMIAARAETGVRRQVFFIEMLGFDTHASQAVRLPPLQRELDEGLARFTDWLSGAGLADAVTTFTASDFGRTLVPNTTGTDHGWGGHQIVLGGAVRGGVYGAVAPATTGHDLDGGRGRMIPTLAVEQTAVPLARWLGLPQSAVPDVFPHAHRFDVDAVPLMRT